MSEIIKENTKGNLIVISGPSGAGKDSIVNELVNKNHNVWVSVSCTSRQPRPGDIEGKTYFFLSRSEFEEKIDEGDFLEYAEYAGNYYGTPKSKIENKLNEGIDVILVIEIQGALKIKELLPNTIFIFILPPSMKELKRRLISRKTEDKEKIYKRFERAYQEINEVTKYNYVVINDNLYEAVNKVDAILLSERCRVDRIEEIYVGNKEEELHELLVDKDLDNEPIEID